MERRDYILLEIEKTVGKSPSTICQPAPASKDS
jgi:hypothetical protein